LCVGRYAVEQHLVINGVFLHVQAISREGLEIYHQFGLVAQDSEELAGTQACSRRKA
jgi:hypothetical protein